MQLTVVEYLVKKLELLGIKNVFGLPGDYNFNILDAIIKSKNINWTNCTNELNAGYASDGYARMNGYGAIVTTYGVGELSAINAIAGSYAENIPVIHIAGVPKTSFIENDIVVHHNFAKADYFVFERIYKNVTKTTAYLTFRNAKEEIDRVIDVMVNEKQPVYIAIPVDVCCHLIDDCGFEKINIKKSNPKNLENAFNKINDLIKASKNPIIFVDYLIKRFNLEKEVETLINRTSIKCSALLMGKGAINEENENFKGINSGNFSNPLLIKEIQDSDLLITFGFLNADLNTGGFTVFEKEPDIQINKTNVKINGEIYEEVLIQDIVKVMAEKIQTVFEKTDKKQEEKEKEISDKERKITVKDLPSMIQSIFESEDTFVMETGLMSLSGAFMNLKEGMNYLAQTLWGSIGWATPAAFGAMMADKKRNLILFTGEGAHQLTVQEMANFFEYDLKPIIFVLNNKGYTVERVLSKDANDKFNDITNWDYTKLPEVFSNGKDFYTAKIKTIKEFEEILPKIKELKGKKFCYIEIFTDPTDITDLGPKLVSNMKEFSKTLS